MKPRPSFFARLLLPAAALISFSGSAHAASGAWQGLVDTTWAGANWSFAPAPGTGEIATFNADALTVNNRTTIDLGAGVTIGTIVFDTANAAAYTIGSGAVGSQTLTLDNTGAVTMINTVANSQLFNSNITLGTAITGTTTFTNSTTAVSGVALNIAGNITGGTGGTAGTKTLNTTGTGAINLQGTINKGGATVINVANIGTGNTTLSGSGTSALGTLRATGAATMTVNNASANITVASSSQYGSSTLSGKFILTNGTVAFNGGIQSATSSGALAGGDGMGFIVNGGTFSASYVSLGRSYNFSTTAGATVTTAQTMGTSGFQVNGGTASVTGIVDIAGSNSAANGQVSGSGSLTIGGELRLGATNTRTNLFQVTGGTLTNTDATNGGIVIGRGTATAATSGELLLTGGTTTTEKITFGLSGGLAGSYGNLTLNGASANLYVGSGGIVKAATNAYTQTINLASGTLGAKDTWSSSQNMSLTGSGVTIKAADASDVTKNITLSGVISGANGFTKSGAGTLALSNANTFSGTLTASSGTTRIDNTLAAQNSTVSIGAANALAFGTGITTATFAGLSGASDLALTNTDSNAVVLSVGNNNVASSYTGAFSGAGSVAKIGTGTLALNGNSNAYTGGIALNNGTLSIGNSNGAGTSASTITAVTGTTVLANSGLSANNVAAAITLSGTNANVTLTNANGSGGFASAISGSTDQTLTISQAGGQNVNLNATNKQLQNFYGTVSIASGQNLAFRATSLNNGSDNALFNVNGSISTRNAGALALGALTGSGTLGMGGSGLSGQHLTYTIGARNTNATFSGVIQDGDTANNKLVNVTKTGTGTQTFSGPNTYTGATVVNAGTLAINGDQSAATGAVSVNNALTRLIGTGTVGGNTTINSGAIQSAGGAIANLDKVGKQTFDAAGAPTTNLTFTSGSIFEWDLNANTDTDGYDHDSDIGTANTNVGVRGTDFDAVDVSGTLTVASEDLTGAIFRVVLGSSVVSDTFWQETQTWTNIFGGGYSLSGAGFNNSLLQVVDTAGLAYNQSTLNPGYTFSVSGNTLTWSAVPEPTSALAGLLLAAGLLRRRRRA